MPLISIFPRINATTGGQDYELHDMFQAIRDGDWSEPIAIIRNAVSQGKTKKEVAALKTATLPYFTGAGTFSIRNESGLMQHSGRLIIDFDHIADLPRAKELLACDKYSEAVFLSCTGRGLAVVTVIDPARHAESFLFLQKYYKEKYNILDTEGEQAFDESCKDISRARFVSHDPDIFINLNPIRVEPPTKTVDGDQEKFDWVLRVHNKRQAYVEGNRHHYLVVLLFFLNKTGVDAEYALYRCINEFQNEDKTEQEITKIAKYCYANNNDHGSFTINKSREELPEEHVQGIREVYAFAHKTNQSGRYPGKDDVTMMCTSYALPIKAVEDIFNYVRDNFKDEFDIEKKPDIVKVRLALSKKYSIEMNEITGMLSILEIATGIERNSDDLNGFLQEIGFKYSIHNIRSLLNQSTFVKKYNPFVNYFESLDGWDESMPDHIGALAGYVKAEHQDFWVGQFRKALVRMVACVLGKTENRIVMVLSGEKEETGKTTFVRFLLPPALKGYYTDNVMSGDKDSDIALCENFIWLLDELSALSKIEVNKLKGIISKSKVKTRRAYRHDAETYNRCVSFWGTTNHDDFLTDTGNNTRWLCFKIDDINHNYCNKKTGIAEIDINKVWAQAYALYMSGFDFELKADERLKRTEINKQFEQSYTEKELVASTWNVGGEDFLTATEMLSQLQKQYPEIRLTAWHVGKALKQLGFVKKSKRVGGNLLHGYFVERINKMPGDTSIQYDPEPGEKPF